MKYFYLLLFTLLYHFVSAQDFDRESVTYKITRENTDIKYITEKINIWDNQISGSRFTMSGGFGTSIYINGIILNACYDYQYLDDLAAAGKKLYGESIYKPTKSRYGDINIGYFYQNKTRKKVSIHLGSNPEKRSMNTSYVTKIDAEIIRFFGLQAGMRKGFSHITIPNIVNVTSIGDVPKTVETQGPISTFMSYKWMYFGASYGRIEDVKAMFSTFGENGSNLFKRYYFNVLFATDAQLEDIYMEDQLYNGNYKAYRAYSLSNVNFSNTGFQLGFEKTNFKKKVSINYGIEGGIYPGIANSRDDNMFLVLRWSITFNQYFGGKDYKYEPINNGSDGE